MTGSYMKRNIGLKWIKCVMKTYYPHIETRANQLTGFYMRERDLHKIFWEVRENHNADYDYTLTFEEKK